MAEKELRGDTKNGNISKSDKRNGSYEEIWSATSKRRKHVYNCNSYQEIKLWPIAITANNNQFLSRYKIVNCYYWQDNMIRIQIFQTTCLTILKYSLPIKTTAMIFTYFFVFILVLVFLMNVPHLVLIFWSYVLIGNFPPIMTENHCLFFSSMEWLLF